MADRLVSIFGTEKDKVNCPFYFKIGACRHGDKCSRRHNKPALSQTVILKNMYQKPVDPIAMMMGTQQPGALQGKSSSNDAETQRHFEDFYEDIFSELSAHGEVEEMHLMENLGDHLNGNVYVKFYTEDDASKAMTALQGRFYAGRQIVAEFSPVTDFREARCRQYDIGMCDRGGFCNFMHIRPVPRELSRMLFQEQSKKYRGRGRARSHSRSRSRSRSRSNSPRRDRGDRDRGDKDRERDRERGGDRDRDRERGDRDRRDRDRDGRERERGDRDRGDRDRDGDRKKASGTNNVPLGGPPKMATS